MDTSVDLLTMPAIVQSRGLAVLLNHVAVLSARVGILETKLGLPVVGSDPIHDAALVAEATRIKNELADAMQRAMEEAVKDFPR